MPLLFNLAQGVTSLNIKIILVKVIRPAGVI